MRYISWRLSATDARHPGQFAPTAVHRKVLSGKPPLVFQHQQLHDEWVRCSSRSLLAARGANTPARRASVVCHSTRSQQGARSGTHLDPDLTRYDSRECCTSLVCCARNAGPTLARNVVYVEASRARTFDSPNALVEQAELNKLGIYIYLNHSRVGSSAVKARCVQRVTTATATQLPRYHC